MNPLRILCAADVPPDPDSGAAGTELRTIEALRALGHEVDAIWAGDLRHRIRHGNLHYLLELPAAYRDAIAARCAARDYDVIHVNQPYAWLAARHHRRLGRPGVFVNRSHGWEPRVTAVMRPWRRTYGAPEWRFPRGLVGRPVRWVLEELYPRSVVRHADGILVSSSEDRDFIVRRYAVEAERVACVPQAPAAAFLRAPAPSMTPDRLRRVLYVGQYTLVKGTPVLAELFSRLAAERPELTLTWCCAEAAHAAARATLRPPADRTVRFVPWMPQDRLLQLYDEHGIFVFPSFYEGFGKACLEAMSRGLCVVAAATGGMRDVVVHGRNGWLVPVGDAAGFLRAVFEAAGNLAAAQEVSRAAAAAAARYSWERVARETATFYAALLGRRACPPA